MDVDELQKVEENYIDMVLPIAPRGKNVSISFVFSVIEQLSDAVRKLTLRVKYGFKPALRFLIAAVEDSLLRVLPLPDAWEDEEPGGVRLFKKTAALRQLLGIALVMNGPKSYQFIIFVCL